MLQLDSTSMFYYIQCVLLFFIIGCAGILLLRLLIGIFIKFTFYAIGLVILCIGLLYLSDSLAKSQDLDFLPTFASIKENTSDFTDRWNALRNPKLAIDKKGKNYAIDASYTKKGKLKLYGEAKAYDFGAVENMLTFSATLVTKLGMEKSLEDTTTLKDKEKRKETTETLKDNSQALLDEIKADPKAFTKKYKKDMESENGLQVGDFMLQLKDERVILQNHHTKNH